MEKYRVRLKSGRVVGPFLSEQILEMKDKGHVIGPEDCQLFPAGDWIRLDTFEFWQSTSSILSASESTFVIELTQKKAALLNDVSPTPDTKSSSSVASPNITDPVPPPPDAAAFREFDYRQSQLEENEIIPLPKHATADIKLDIKAPKKEQPEDDNEKTTLRIMQVRKTAIAPAQEDKTTVTPAGREWREKLESERKRVEDQNKKKEEEEKNKGKAAALERVDYNSDATQAISIKDIKAKASDEGRRNEKELMQQEQAIASARKAEEDRILAEEATETAKKVAEEKQEASRAVRKNFVLVAVLVLVLLAVLFPGEKAPPRKSSKIVPIDPIINFPVPFDIKDKIKADQFQAIAREKLVVGTYPAKIDAAKAYRLVYENDTERKEALTRMIRVYGELLPHSSELQSDGNTLFKLLQANRILQDVDPDVALGAGLFYRALGKTDAGHDVLDRFVKSDLNKPSRELFAAYLIGLSDKNLEARADEVATSLLKTEKRGVDLNLALIHYYRYKNYPEKAREILTVALREAPNSVPLLIAEGDFLLEGVDMKGLLKNIIKINELEAEKSRIYFGKLLEFQGFIYAYQGKTKEATEKFAESLKFNDSDSLRDRLTNIQGIDSTANDEASKLIKQVKARKLTQEAQAALLKFDFETALLKSLEAQGLASGYIKADLGLAEIQMKLGMTGEALATLEQLQKQHGTDKSANFALLEAYIKNYKLTDAKRLFAIMANSEMRDDWRYSSLNAQMYEKLGDLNQSILWLQKAINQNPLEDQNLYRLSKLFGRAKRFGQAKNNLFKAMELNPVYIEYKLAYAELIYEVDGAEKATEYLFGLLKQFPDNPSILGEIAIYYHRAGKNKQFLNTKKDIEALPVKDPRIYRFLIRASVIDEKFEDSVKYTEEYLKLEPGDLAVMMEMGQTLMKLKRYKEAAVWFVRVRTKLPSYPRVGYYKARIEVYVNNPDQALLDVREDMKLNGEYEEGLNLVGDVLFEKEEFIPAENEYKKSLRINSRSYGALRGLADIAARRGQTDMARDLYKRAIAELKGSGDDPTIHRKLGDVYRLMGQGSLAIESYQVYLKLVPDAQDKAEVEGHIRVLE
jgi:tetratricopeptide (TPR) repeat protein